MDTTNNSTNNVINTNIRSNSNVNQSRLREFALWFHLPTYSTFRYGMITVYVGTLLMVIGYHNPWIAFTRLVNIDTVRETYIIHVLCPQKYRLAHFCRYIMGGFPIKK